MAVTIYAKPNCQPCCMTKLAFERKGVEFREVDITEHPQALAYITEDLGYMQAPVVVVDDHDHWSGFRPDQIERIAAGVAA
ncbi:glutaredoxin family protein [Micrococcus luteus]|uniref:glutaredoxin family protein n=1 Tax=Micrococcus luteus TaxID=1270 RepID=UPI0033E25BE0